MKKINELILYLKGYRLYFVGGVFQTNNQTADFNSTYYGKIKTTEHILQATNVVTEKLKTLYPTHNITRVCIKSVSKL